MPFALRINTEKEPLLFEDTDGSIKTKKSQSTSSSRSNAKSSHSTSTSDASPIFQDSPSEEPLVFLPAPFNESIPPRQLSQTTSTRTSRSSDSSSWSKVSQQEFDYRDRNSFLLLPPPPPPRSNERKTII